MEAEVVATEHENKRAYPYLGITEEGRIVLFSNTGSGVQVNDCGGYLGVYSSTWAEHKFAPFTGTVTLSND